MYIDTMRDIIYVFLCMIVIYAISLIPMYINNLKIKYALKLLEK